MIAPAELRERQQWLLWRFEPNPKKPDGKKLKVPYYVTGSKRWGKQGSEEDRRHLTFYNAAVDAMSRGKFDGIGFAFLPGDGLIGIDLDDALDLHTDQETGEITRAPKKRAAEIIAACKSYTEYSPSGKGVHIFVRGRLERTFKSNEIGVEVFCGEGKGGQYFTFTGEHYPGTPAEVGEIPEAVLRRLKKTVEAAKGQRQAARAPAPAAGGDKRAKVESALAFVNPDLEYNDWLAVGMAIHAELGASGFATWDSWSAKGQKYRSSEDVLSHWRSFEGKQYNEAPLYSFAVKAGWRPPRPGSSRRPVSAEGKPGDVRASTGQEGDANPLSGDDGPPEEEDLPTIRWKQGHLRACVNEGEKALLGLNGTDRLFQRAGMLVRVVRRAAANVRNFRRDPGILGFHIIDPPYLIELMTSAARWMKWDGRSEQWRRINAPEQAAATYLSRVGRWKVPLLWSAISAPTLRPDGTVLQKHGYDEATATWYDPGAIKFPDVPEQPTTEDAERALGTILEAFKTFPFVTAADRAVLLAAVLAALVRRSIAHAPLVAFAAPTSSSGKSLLADLVSIIATGIRAPAMKYPDTDEEAAKLALAVLMEGDPLVLIDNVDRPLQGDWLCTILTSETYRARVLGRSEMISVPSLSMWMATGNNIVLAGDLRTRSLVCRIDPQMEHPEQRMFAEDIKETLARRRPELVAAGLTVMRAFIATKQRVADFVKPWGRFEQWTDMVRAPLVWLDQADPCDTIAALEQDDPERRDLLRMLLAWRAAFGLELSTSRSAVKLAADSTGYQTDAGKQLEEVLRDVAMDRGGAFNVKKLSKFIGRHIGRRVEGMKFVKGRELDHVQTYKVEVVEQKPG